MSACPSVLFNIDSVVKASWRKPQAGWTQEEKNTAEALSNKDILKRLLPKVVDFHLEGVDPAVRARVVTGLHRALSFSIGVAHGKTELLVQIIPRIGAGAGGLGGSDEERAAVLAGIKTAADGLAIEHGLEVRALLSCLYPLKLCMELMAGRLAHELMEEETYSDDAAMTALLRSMSDISIVKAKYAPWFKLDPKAAKFDRVIYERGSSEKKALREEMQFWRTSGAEALFDRWTAGVAGEGCAMWTMHAILARVAADSALFVVQRSAAEHAGLLTNVVLRPHSYSEQLCALLAALWELVHNMPQLVAAFHAANENPHPAGLMAMSNCVVLRDAMDGAVYAGQDELSTFKTALQALKLDRQAQRTQKDVAEVQHSTGRLGTRCDGLEEQVEDLTERLEQEMKARRKLEAQVLQQLRIAMEAAPAKDAGARSASLSQ